jgi:hypothetical protein
MPVQATQFVRRMRGGAQAQLLRADDGQYYVTKFQENPQHRRVLINEWLGHALLRQLGVPAPQHEIVEVPPELIAGEPEMSIQWGSRREPVRPGWHFGSRYPGHPDTMAVYDYLPDVLLKEVVNRNQFLGVLAFDKWAGNADSRQAVFFRAQIREWVDAPPGKKGFVGLMIDHGFLFDGPAWDFVDSPVQGLYHRRLVYDGVKGLADFEPWLDRIQSFPEAVIDAAWRGLPPEWVAEDGPALERLLDRLLARRRRVAGLIEAVARSHQKPFPNWVR